MAASTATTEPVADRGLTSRRGVACVFAQARRSAHPRARDTRVFVAEAGTHASFEAAVAESQGMEARSGLDELEAVRQSDVPPVQ